LKPKHAINKAVVQAGENPAALLTDVRELILSARQTVARRVNAALVMLHWQIGHRVRRDILKEKRAEYGEEIVATLSRQLGWSHFVEVLPLQKHLQGDYYAEMCRVERWSVRRSFCLHCNFPKR
jgi:hypothetical protein